MMKKNIKLLLIFLVPFGFLLNCEYDNPEINDMVKTLFFSGENYSYYKYILMWDSDETLGTGPIAVKNNYLYLCESYNNKIKIFTLSGKIIQQWGGTFYNPAGIAVDDSGYIYIADTGNNRILKYNFYGTNLAAWGTYGSANGQFKSPQGVYVDSSGYIYVADTHNHRIQKFTSSFSHVTSVGSNGSGFMEFNSPTGVVVDSSGYIYIADTGNQRIQKISPLYKYITKWICDNPIALTMDFKDNIYVSQGGYFSKFNSDGILMAKGGSEKDYDESIIEINGLDGITVDSAGYVYLSAIVNDAGIFKGKILQYEYRTAK